MFGAINIVFLFATSAFATQPQFPSYFAKNEGQLPKEVRFELKRAGGSAFFHDKGIALDLPGGQFRAQFVQANPHPLIEGRQKLSAVANFFEGSDPGRWRTQVPLYTQLVYRDLWRGVELSYSTATKYFKSEFRVSPHADPSSIQWSYGPEAHLSIGRDGSLLVQDQDRSLREEAPEIYQRIGATRKRISGNYQISPQNVVSFRFGPYDHDQELVIDPVIVFTSLLGGTGQDNATAIASDPQGNIVVAGWTSSLNFPARSAARQTHLGGAVDAFVAKFSGSGSNLLFCTYFGGSGDDRAYGAALDAVGNIYLVGRTTSSNFPIASALQTALRGTEDGFVTKLNPAGNRILFSTYIGGGGVDAVNAITLDPGGYIYVVGDTSSSDFPLFSAYSSSNQGGQDAFVMKLTPTGNALLYSTYLGGSATDHATAIAVNSAGNAFVTGSTFSTNFPVKSALQATTGGNQDAFLTELAVGGNALVFSTYLGGSSGTAGLPEEADAIVLDSSGNIYIAGTTSSFNFPVTASALQPTFVGGNQDAFLVQYSPLGQSIQYASFLGGTGLDYITGIALDSFGYLTVAGYTSSADFPILRPVQSQFKGIFDAFVTKFNFSGAVCTLINSTYLGGSLADSATAVTLDQDGSALVAGYTSSADFPIVSPVPPLHPYQWTNNGLSNAFVVKLANPYTRATATQTSSGVLFGVDYSRDRLWDTETYSGTYSLFGNPGDIPILGDWNHSGTVKMGIFRNGLWILDLNGNGVLDSADRQFTFGQTGDIPVVGDWDGTGVLRAGIFRGGTWILDFSGHLQGTATGVVDKTYSFGATTDIPITGDWTGTGTTKIGVFRGGFWILDADGNGVLNSSDIWYIFGQSGDTPVTGDWDGSGVTHPGIVRNGVWFLNYRWSSETGALGSNGTALQFQFGKPGSISLAGRNFN